MSTSNEMSGSANTVVQAKTINGDVHIRHECVSYLVVYLQAADALSSSVPLKQYAAFITLAQLVQTYEDMQWPVVDLVRGFSAAEPLAYHRNHKAVRVLVWALAWRTHTGDMLIAGITGSGQRFVDAAIAYARALLEGTEV